MKIRHNLFTAMTAILLPLAATAGISSLGNGSLSGSSSELSTDTLDNPRHEGGPRHDGHKDGMTDDKKGDKKGGKPAEKKDSYEALIKKGGSVMTGLFTVRHIEDKWYFEIPDSLMDRYLLAVTRFTAVPQNFGKFAGEEANGSTLYFTQRDPKTILLKAYVLTQVADPDDNISATLKASTADPIVASFKVIGRNKKTKAQMIDVTSLFTKENEVVGLGSDAKRMKLGGLMADRTFVDTIKTYPINLEISTTRTYSAQRSSSPASGSGAITLGLNTSMLLLPKEPMQRRLWDERVGYFTNRFTYFSDAQHKTDREQAITRFRLVPKNVKAYLQGKLVEPVKPIVFYIDPATPAKWVPYLKAGINDWNVAFEAAGFKNAIQAKDWPKDRPDMSIDDARYNVLLYLPSEVENAYGPHVSDPRSGEILESHICWFHNVMSLLTKWYMTQCGPTDKRARTMKFDDKLMGELIRFVSSHEVGHTLGLRHNMGASHATPVENLRNKQWVEAHGHTASIMDYARFNYVAQPEDGISERGLFPRINDYDKWAIKWGYQYRPEFKDEFKEKEVLRKETTAKLRSNPRLWFGGEGRNEDPRAQTEDLGDDNVKASDYGVKNLKRVVANLPEWTRQADGQYDDLEDMWGSVVSQFKRYTNHVLKNIGGRYLNNMPDRPQYEIAPASKQSAAVDYLGRQLFTAPLWLYPDNINGITGKNPVAEISSEQARVLKVMMNAYMLDKIYSNSLASAKGYKLDSYLDDLMHAVWKPLTAQDERVNACRRNLERAFVDNINSILNPSASPAPATTAPRPGNGRSNSMQSQSSQVSSDAPLFASQLLDKVEAYAKAQQAQASSVNALHYKDILRRIKMIRDRMVTVK